MEIARGRVRMQRGVQRGALLLGRGAWSGIFDELGSFLFGFGCVWGIELCRVLVWLVMSWGCLRERFDLRR